MFFERGIEVLYVGPVVHVVMQMHRLLIDDGLKGRVVVRQCWYFMRHDLSSKTLKMTGNRTGIQMPTLYRSCILGVAVWEFEASSRQATAISRQLSRYIDRVREDPERPATPTGEARLAQVGFRPVTSGTRDGKIERLRFLTRDFVAVAKNTDFCRVCNWRKFDVQDFAFSPRNRVARSRGSGRGGDGLRESLRGRQGVHRAKGVPGLDCLQNLVGSCFVGILAWHIVHQNVLPSEAENRKITWEVGDAEAIEQEIRVGIGAADAGHWPFREEFVPLGEVLVGRTRKPQQRQSRIHRINKGSDSDIDDLVLAPDGVVIENFDSVVVLGAPVGPAIAEPVRVSDEVHRTMRA